MDDIAYQNFLSSNAQLDEAITKATEMVGKPFGRLFYRILFPLYLVRLNKLLKRYMKEIDKLADCRDCEKCKITGPNKTADITARLAKEYEDFNKLNIALKKFGYPGFIIKYNTTTLDALREKYEDYLLIPQIEAAINELDFDNLKPTENWEELIDSL